MGKSRGWKAWSISSLVILQLSSVILPSYMSAAEMTSEVESSQTLELPENSNESVVNEEPVEEVVEEESVVAPEPEKEIIEPVIEESVEEEIVEEIIEEEIPTEEVMEDVVPEESPEAATDITEEIPQMSTFSRVAAHKEVNYVATIFKGTSSIDSLPWGEPGFKKIGHTKDYLGKTVRVTKESSNGAYGYVHIEGLGNGWIDLRAMKALDVVAVDYYDYVSEGKYGIDTLPWGTEGFTSLGKTSHYLGNQVHIIYQSTNGAYLYAELNGEAIGWIDARAFGLVGNEYTALVKNGNYSIDTLPWGTPGFTTVSSAKSYIGQELTVVGSAQGGSYVLIYINGEELGWVDKRAVGLFETKSVSYQSYIGSGSYSIDTLPWGTPGFKNIGKTNILIGNYVTVTRESTNGAYAFVTVDGLGKGWIDKKALGLRGSSYPATFVNMNFSIDSLPWGTPGFKKISSTSEFMGRELQVMGTTDGGSYSLVSENGKVLGWVDTRALKPMNYKTVNYTMPVSGAQYAINTLPWGDIGFKKTGTTNSYVGLNLTITKESSNGAYLFASHNGKALGWIDKRAFGFTPHSYSLYIVNGNYSLDTLPWGTVGHAKINSTQSLVGKELTVIAETQNGAYLKVAHFGEVLGWIDARSGKKLNEKVITYTSTINKAGYAIDTLPWGTPGFTNRGASKNNLGKSVIVSRESSGGHYAFITDALSGVALGWIDKKALKTETVVFLDVGHGGSDSGAYYFGVKEKDINMEVSKKIQSNLENAGFKVIMSRTNDKFIDHKTERSEMANASGADIFISVHHNAMPGNSVVNGIETFYYEYDPDYPSKINQQFHNDPSRVKESALLASAIHNQLIRTTGAFNRGVRTDTFAVLRETAVPSVLLELGFMSNRAELNKLTSASYQNVLAKAVSDGVINYFNTK